MSAKQTPPPKDAPFAVKLAYYAEGPVEVRLCAQMKYYNRECRGHLVDRYCPTLRGHMFVSGPCKDWHDPDRARRAGQKILARMRRQLADIALEEALTKAANEPLTDDELSIVDAAYERGKALMAEVRINMLERRIATLQADLAAALTVPSIQSAPSDRERQYMEALAVYAKDEDRYIRGEGEPYGSIPVEVGAIARQARSALSSSQDKAQTPPERHAICGNCGWTGPESGLFDDGKFIFCPQCRNCDGNTLRPVEVPPPAAVALMDDTLEGHE